MNKDAEIVVPVPVPVVPATPVISPPVNDNAFLGEHTAAPVPAIGGGSISGMPQPEEGHSFFVIMIVCAVIISGLYQMFKRYV